MDLQDRIVLVTGASSGIGAATAERFAREGADVALLARSREGLEVVAARVRAHGRKALVLPCDVTDARGVGDAVARIEEELGGLDVVVSNAAAVVFGRFEQVSPEDFDRTVAVTFTGAVNVIRSTLPALARRNGTIVVVGSIMTKLPLPTFSSYAAAKHALRGFLSSLRIELHAAGDPVTISLVNPGSVDSPLWEHTTTATGRQARKPPEGYKPEVYAAAIVSCARHPRSEITLGGEARLLELAYLYARPVGERILGFAHRLYRSGVDPPAGAGSLWEPMGDGRIRDGMHGRPSLWTPVRLRLRVPSRLGRRR
jgi:NAD(P)-dependent dehydrogenase (short-subunit alcohol dehydrogenase family)